MDKEKQMDEVLTDHMFGNMCCEARINFDCDGSGREFMKELYSDKSFRTNRQVFVKKVSEATQDKPVIMIKIGDQKLVTTAIQFLEVADSVRSFVMAGLLSRPVAAARAEAATDSPTDEPKR